MNKNALYAVLFIGLGVYYAYDTYYPQYVGWETEIVDLQQKIEVARQTAPRLAEIKQEETELKERLRASLEKLPSASELSDLLVMILPIIEKVGIPSSTIASKNVEAAVEQDVYRVHPIKISGIKDLTMDRAMRLLFELRNFHRIVNVQSFTLAQTGPDRFDVDLNLETYSYIEPEGEMIDLGTDEAAPAAAEAPAAEAEASEDTTAAAATDTPSGGTNP